MGLIGMGGVVQWIKPVLVVLASHVKELVQILAILCFSSRFQLMPLKGSGEWAKYLSSVTYMGDSVGVFDSWLQLD